MPRYSALLYMRRQNSPVLLVAVLALLLSFLLAFVQVPTSAASVNGVQEQRKEVYGEEEDLLVMEVDTEPSIEAEDETYWENEERQNEDEAEDPRDIFYAVKNDSPIEIGGMLSLDPTILDMKGPGGQTPLMHAVLGGHLNAAKYLLSRGANVSITEDKGYTPAHGAGFQGRYKMVALLDRHNVPLNEMHEDGFRPIHRACWGWEERHTRTVAAFINAGVSPITRTKEGKRPLEITKQLNTQRLLRQAEYAMEEGVKLEIDLVGGEEADIAKEGL